MSSSLAGTGRLQAETASVSSAPADGAPADDVPADGAPAHEARAHPAATPAGAHGSPVATRHHLSERQAETLARLLEATAEELRSRGWSGLTVRNVARRAGVAPATAYTYFASREHLVTEVYRRRLAELPRPAPRPGAEPAERATTALAPVALLVADEPALAAAVTVAMLSDDPEVAGLRGEVGAETAARIAEAVGDDATASRLLAMEAAFSGLLLRAGMGYLAYAEVPDRVAEVAEVVFGPGTPTTMRSGGTP